MSTQSETNERLARIEEQLKGIKAALIPPKEIYTGLENIKTRLGTLEECNRENKRFRWRWITAISAALISSIGAILTALFRYQ